MGEAKLTKESSGEQLRQYFTAIMRLSESGEDFPVNLDDVWMLAYGRKDAALTALKNGEFYDGSDYVASQNQKVVNINELENGVRVDVKISVSCMEYLIARKVRAVFEVYRQVFHKVAKPLSQLEILQGSVNALVEHDKRLRAVEQRLNDIDKEREENGRLLLEAKLSDIPTPQQSVRSRINELVCEYARATNTAHRDVWNTIYKKLKYLYHISINSYKKVKPTETKLDVVERIGALENVLSIISEMINDFKVKTA